MDAPVVRREDGESLRIGPTTTVVEVPGAAVRDRFDMAPRAALFRLSFPVLGPLIRRQVRATVDHLGAVLAAEVTPRSRPRDGRRSAD